MRWSFWEKNTIVIEDGNEPFPRGISHLKPFTRFPFDQLHDVVIESHGIDRCITPCYDNLAKILYAVAWQPQPSVMSELTTLTVKLVINFAMIYPDLEDIPSSPDNPAIWKNTIRTKLPDWISATTCGGRLKTVPKKTIVEPDYSYSKPTGPDGPPNAELLLSLFEMGLEELHKEFGEEVWMKDRLCYKDGTLFEKAFRMEDFLAANKAR